MTILFVSDLHLDASHPQITRHFLEFLSERGGHCRALYILGDLFEYWLGDDDPDPDKREVVRALYDLTQSGVPTYFIHGNRDFMIGKRFACESGVQLLPDPHIIDINGQSVLISHGDLLCTDDHQYQRYRQRITKPWMKALLRAGPLWFRTWLANRGRKRSRRVSATKAEHLMDVNQQAVESLMQEQQVQVLIHGHTHRPKVHQFQINGQANTRIVLGDWYSQGSVLRWEEDGRFELEALIRN